MRRLDTEQLLQAAPIGAETPRRSRPENQAEQGAETMSNPRATQAIDST